MTSSAARDSVIRFPEPSPDLVELLKLKLRPYSQILLSKNPVKT
jgi:hypothetical protein